VVSAGANDHFILQEFVMLVRFTSKSAASVSMFEKDAALMLKLMGHSGTIPSAIRAKDVADRLATLEKALAAEAPVQEAATEDDEPPIPASRRAWPLTELLRAAIATDEDVMWDYEHSAF
jgi:mannose/cellobiose epimerase-like protein (N-acyl-D-glucosamine 2-epimerase family)